MKELSLDFEPVVLKMGLVLVLVGLVFRFVFVDAPSLPQFENPNLGRNCWPGHSLLLVYWCVGVYTVVYACTGLCIFWAG